ncbi:MAG: thermonuclease family protein [Cyanobacteria bacterium]|nr:thermonuclease family protein [Cyanobacteriota bacterium]
MTLPTSLSFQWFQTKNFSKAMAFSGLLLLGYIGISAQSFAEKVCYVSKGDTLHLCSGQVVKLWGVAAPEITQPFGDKSRELLAHIVRGKEINLNCPGKANDVFICRARVYGFDIAKDMVSWGLAFDAAKQSHGTYSPLEVLAKKQKRGVWKLSQGGIRPWDYRKHTSD